MKDRELRNILLELGIIKQYDNRLMQPSKSIVSGYCPLCHRTDLIHEDIIYKHYIDLKLKKISEQLEELLKKKR